MKRLVLFDIDGTLLNGGRLWRECFEGAFAELFPGRAFPRVPFSGKTDRQICAEALGRTLEELHLCAPEIDALIDGYLTRAERAIEAGRTDEVVILPGVRPLLDELAALPGIHLGLLTGNVRRGADMKLGCVGLDGYFRTGAFGDDHADRYRLPAIAVARALEEQGTRYVGKEVVIIGDTAHDVNCGKSIGVRSIAVGTGRSDSQEELLAANPDHYFPTLEARDAVLAAILGAGGKAGGQE